MSSSPSIFKKKPKTAKGRRVAEDREPKVVEDQKKTMFINGHSTCQVVKDCMRDLKICKNPAAVALSRKNEILPFEDSSKLEFLSRANDASLFVLGSHTKKRPNNLIFGRFFDHHLLDMFEFGVSNFKSLNDFKNSKNAVGSKPVLLFQGTEWESEAQYQQIRNYFVDFFSGEVVKRIDLQGLDHVFVFTIGSFNENGAEAPAVVIFLKHYSITFKKSGTSVPRVVLTEIGPSVDLRVRRTSMADQNVLNNAMRTPKETTPKKRKNVETNAFGETIGTIHMPRQDIKQMALSKRLKSLTSKSASKEEGEGDQE